MVKIEELEDKHIDPLVLGYSLLLTILMVGLILTCIAGLFAGYVLNDADLLAYMADLCSNGGIWGVLFGLAIVIPALILLFEAITRYRHRKPSEENISSVFVGFGNLALFLIFADISMSLSQVFVECMKLDYTLNVTSLFAAQIVIAALYLGIYVSIFTINAKSSKRIIEEKSIKLLEEPKEEVKTE